MEPTPLTPQEQEQLNKQRKLSDIISGDCGCKDAKACSCSGRGLGKPLREMQQSPGRQRPSFVRG
jgi:hypothetical protein